MEDPKERYQRLAAATRVFTPGSPIDSLDLFSGRMDQVMDILGAINQKGQHVALYGERGVGKTSIASILAEALGKRPNAARPVSVRVGCSTDDDFQSVWRTIFRELGIGQDEYERIRPASIRESLRGLEDRTLIVIDELDRLVDDEALSLISDTVKTLSDMPVSATIVLVGVADSIDQLVGDHKSVSRALRQVQIPRMSANELGGIVDKGAQALGIEVHPSLRSRIAELSEGLPHYTHALSLHAIERAIGDDKDKLTDSDVDNAITKTVQKSQRTIMTAHNLATRSAREDALYHQVLLACALAPKDELGLFAARDVIRPLSMIMRKRYEIPAFAKHLNKFSSEDRGDVLQKLGKHRRYFYRFADPMMQPFVILHGLSHRLIDENVISRIKTKTRVNTGC